ncbi:hypothetical protein DMB66_15935 [Actinoplanes sp. ATCC 53533]|uniref:hypothetical protein n=1 Tax=Actinoplanes sp. ATCC 53533 TaxID=1288362 RepID=UPI000F7B31F7|nr:hypothetical protein [Actinoplanes sp. ATCC 53533]RSM67443.1 hypothetical protein DMB66_15935 [Actinoplanes sp. ATCC 53533]
MRNALTRIVTIAAVALGLTLTATAPVLASADKCKGDAFASCVAVNGKKRHVNWIKSRVALYAKTCRYGHSQVLINNKHYADSNGGRDKDYCSKSVFGDEVTTGTWKVNRNYAKGTKICSKFWVRTGATGPGTVNGYQSLGTACATIG